MQVADPTQRAATPAACALSGGGTSGGWAYLPSVSTMTFLPLFDTVIQLAVMTLCGNGSGTRERRTSATTTRVRQRAVPSDRTQTLPSPLASQDGWLGQPGGAVAP